MLVVVAESCDWFFTGWVVQGTSPTIERPVYLETFDCRLWKAKKMRMEMYPQM